VTINIQQAMNLANVSRRTVYNWIAAEKCKAYGSRKGARIVRATVPAKHQGRRLR